MVPVTEIKAYSSHLDSFRFSNLLPWFRSANNDGQGIVMNDKQKLDVAIGAAIFREDQLNTSAYTTEKRDGRFFVHAE